MVGVVAVVLGATACGASTGAEGSVLRVERAAFPVALTTDREGVLLYAERLTGRIRRVREADGVDPTSVARVGVATEGQRGLLGVARDGRGRIFAAYTSRAIGRPLQVAQVVPAFRVVWIGPPSANLANGGHLVYDRRRRQLILGIGDLGQRAKVADPNAVNGKLLLLDPDAALTQHPAVLSQGWNNPFAFTLTPGGALWVADNVPGEKGERIARGDVGGRPSHITMLPTNTVPAAIAALSDTTLVVCGFAHGRTLRYEIRSGRAVKGDGFGDDARCRTGIATGTHGVALWLADERSIRELTSRR